MLHISQMLQTHPAMPRMDAGVLTACIEACLDCGQTCTSCADACLSEQHVQKLTQCIRLNLDCADACFAAARTLSRQTAPNGQLLRAQIEAMRLACRLCGDECERHAKMMEHCRVCAEACRACEEACDALLNSATTARA